MQFIAEIPMREVFYYLQLKAAYVIPPVLDSSSSNLGATTIQEIPGPLPSPVSNGVGVSVCGGRQWFKKGGGSKWHIHV